MEMCITATFDKPAYVATLWVYYYDASTGNYINEYDVVDRYMDGLETICYARYVPKNYVDKKLYVGDAINF